MKRTFIEGTDENGEHWGQVIDDEDLPAERVGKVIHFEGWNDYDATVLSPHELFQIKKEIFASMMGITMDEVEAIIHENSAKHIPFQRRDLRQVLRPGSLVIRRKS